MPSSSTNYSYDIPTVGSDSSTYGTIINQFVNSLATKLKAVSDAINTAGVGASSTLAQVNRNIAQVSAINSRLPVGVADLLPDPYSGATTPVSTWPYLNTELQAQGFSPPTTAQEVLDFDYSGFATYLNTRFDSLSARIVGLDAPITIADSSTLVCETNAILNTIGEYKDVTTTTTTLTSEKTNFYSLGRTRVNVYGSGLYHYLFDNLANALIDESIGSFSNGIYTGTITITDVATKLAAGEDLDPGIYLQSTTVDTVSTLTISPSSSNQIVAEGGFPSIGTVTDNSPHIANFANVNYSTLGTYNPSPYFFTAIDLTFVKVVKTLTTTDTTTSVKKTIDDVDFSGCS